MTIQCSGRHRAGRKVARARYKTSRLGPSIPSLPLIGSSAALGQVALPVFLALTAWGVLGKFEKWTQPVAPQAATA